ncbi:MAG: MBL fold metallo-hydrolase [Gemmatimonadota bacterium]|nr:MAG: MBL fold metallo-hydrolase [Gemmatimonadota bacterium]
MKTGTIEWHLVSDGTFRLDGGAMFGVVPKPLWQKKSPPDESNRIRLGTNCLLLKTAGRVILVDTGLGRKENARFREIYGVANDANLVDSLAGHGVKPEDVDTVVYTHLHFDHAGGGTRREGDAAVPVFPNARHLVHATELHDAENPTVRSSASYLPDNWVPLREAGLLDVLHDETEIVPGVRTFVRPGHVRALTGVLLESGGEKAIYPSDNMPTSAHVPIPWVMGYDLYPLDTVATKVEFLDRAIDEEWTFIFEHDPEVGAAKVRRDGRHLVVEPVLPAPTAGGAVTP